ncbi:MAG: hypothetical protein M3Z03_10835, partial [Actinomycetota bacterium]|nr:hypothetical protein [Actinomycetota bacterium]
IGFDRGGGTFPELGGSSSPVAGEPPSAGPDPAAARSVADVWGDRVGLLYLSFTLGALALCLTPRLTLPARLPGARS